MKRTPLEDLDQRRLRDFRTFYGVVITLRDRLCADASLVPEPPPRANLVEAVQQHLRDGLVDLGYGLPLPDGDANVDAGYVMVAMADEVMLATTTPWDGRSAWVRRPLERLIYGTRLAGDRIFETAENLVASGQDKSGTAVLILTCLLLGYQGRYREEENAAAEINALRDRLEALVYGAEAAKSRPKVTFDVNTAPLTRRSPRRLPALWPWLAAICAVALAYAPLTHLIWRLEIGKVAELASQIVEDDGGDRGSRR